MNPDSVPKIAFLGLVVICIALTAFAVHPNRGLQEYYKRSCQGKAWKRNFPKSSNNDIRRFLSLFADAFLIPEKEQLRFLPDDKLLEIYRAIYPSKFMADTLEFNFFTINIRESYNIDFTQIWHENLTLGELFSLTQAA